ncbi:MAG: hypothetical protein KDD95_14800, partial [Rhodobacteraceae bacterium]|nr:hypothetical protein [Paracoccaceae bacterium]MCB2159585.1 hypothetical protein [Paracoccaceae bacterium]
MTRAPIRGAFDLPLALSKPRAVGIVVFLCAPMTTNACLIFGAGLVIFRQWSAAGMAHIVPR